jgi:hypothetical protein
MVPSKKTWKEKRIAREKGGSEARARKNMMGSVGKLMLVWFFTYQRSLDCMCKKPHGWTLEPLKPSLRSHNRLRGT